MHEKSIVFFFQSFFCMSWQQKGDTQFYVIAIFPYIALVSQNLVKVF